MDNTAAIMSLSHCVLFVCATLVVSIACQEASISTRLDFCPAPCGLPMISLGGTEYYIHTSSKVTWFEAYEICRVNHLKLLSIESAAENNIIKRGIAMRDLNSPFWTSGNDIENEGTWIWRSTGQPVTFFNWETNQPQNFNDGDEHCIFIGNWGQKKVPMWHDAPCTWKLFFVCEKSVLDFCPAPCGLPLISLGGTEYYIHTSSKVTWFEAYEICRVNQLKLLSIETAAENNFIKRGIAMRGSITPFWTSGNDIESEGKWIWRSTGQSITFFNWETNQPENTEGAEHCISIGNWVQNKLPLWHDASCSYNLFFVCEKTV
ncbi:hypothetical protein B566_EDAN010150 [Ephemera danica]|nr:hypothetical protein B566_EDAN010150 [Ephemera danica]